MTKANNPEVLHSLQKNAFQAIRYHVLAFGILLLVNFSAHAATIGVISTVAGGGVTQGDGGAATAAIINPFGVAVDGSGNIYINEYGNNRIRKVAVGTEIITTVAGNGSAGYSGDGGLATSARFDSPPNIAVDSAGNLYIADQNNNRIRKVTAATGIITTVAGNGTAGFSGDGGLATSASLAFPSGIAIDSAGNLYILCSTRIRKVAAGTGVITTVAGNGSGGFSGDGGPAISASFNNPFAVAVDNAGNLYISDFFNNRIRKVTASTGIISTYAGNGSQGFAGDGGPATNASFGGVYGVTLDNTENLFIADPGNNNIRMVSSSTGNISTVAGNGTGGYSGDGGQATAAALNAPIGVALDSVGNLYIADYINGRIRKVILYVGPTASTAPASSVTATGATLNGTVNDNGADTTVSFEYGLSTGYGSSISGGTIASGNGSKSVSVSITGLSCNSTYHFRVNAVSSDGTANGSDQSFTTAGCIPATAPTAITGTASAVTATGATLNGTVNDHFGNTTVTFEYGLTTAYGTSISGGNVTTGSGDTPVNAVITGLTCNTTYHFRVHAENSAGTTNGLDQTVTTAVCGPLAAMQRSIRTIAGGWIGDVSAATSAGLAKPSGVALDSAGNQYIADTNNNRIRRVDAGTGIVTTVAGNGNGGFSGDGGAATSAMLLNPSGVTVDSAGNLYIADSGNNRIRKVAFGSGVILTVAGNGTAAFSGDGGSATAASLSFPSGVAIDSSGNLYINDGGNNRIRKVASAGSIISTVAGNGSIFFSGDGGAATSAALNPTGVAVDSGGNLFIADNYNCRIRKVASASGIISTVAGGGINGLGDGGAATSAMLFNPSGITLDSTGNLFIADNYNYRIRKVAAGSGIITTVAGNGSNGFSGDGGAATSASIYFPTGMATDSSGNLYFADTNNSRIRKVAAGSGIISTVAGGIVGDGGQATSAGLFGPHEVAVDSSGNLYIADRYDNRIRKVAATTGVITTVAGNGSRGYSGDGGAATTANINNPWRVAVDTVGNLFIADSSNNRIRKVAAGTGVITTIAGNGTTGFSGDGSLATLASLASPLGIAVDSAGNLFIASSNRIRKVDATSGIITTVAGNGTATFSGDGGPATAASLNSPRHVAVDNIGNLYITDAQNYRIRKVTAATGIITTVAGNGSGTFSGDGGAATSAGIYPWGLCVDGGGNLYFTDLSSSSRIRLVVADNGIIATVAGSETSGYSGDGGAATSAMLNAPMGIAVDSTGNLYIADYINNRIRMVSGVPRKLTVASSTPTSGVSFSANPPDLSDISSGSTRLTLTYAQGTSVTLTAPASSGGNYFGGWAGCDTISGLTCTVSMLSDKTVTVLYGALPHPPAIPVPNPGNGQVELSWFAWPGATSYNLYYSTAPGVTKATGTKLSNVTSPYTVAPLSNGTTYYFVLTSVIAGVESAESGELSAIPTISTAAYTLADLAGVWYSNSVASGPGAPWWERATITIASNGVFSGSSLESAGSTGSHSGTLVITSDGRVYASGSSDTSWCRLDAGKTVMVCTDTFTSGSPGTTEMKVFTKKASSYAQADLAGDWAVNQIGTPGPHFLRAAVSISGDGSLFFAYNSDNTSSGTITGSAAINADGKVTISLLSASLTETCTMDASKTVMACVDTDTSHNNQALLTIYTKKAASYAQSDVTGIWGLNDLATSPGAPWWLRASLTVDTNGVFTGTGIDSDSNIESMSGSLTLSQTGTITSNVNNSSQCVMNAGKTVVACTSVWNSGSPGTAELGVMTKQAVPALKKLTGLLIGSDVVATRFALYENSSASYHAIASWSDGPTSFVNPVWSVNPTAYASINSSTGVLTTLAVPANQTVMITASYTYGGTTLTVTRPLTIVKQSIGFSLDISGTGNGSVNSVPAGLIACTWSPLSGTCATNQPANTSFTLSATPGGDSSFGGWGGSCSSCNGLTCNIMLDNDKNCAATMTILPLVRIIGSNYYASIAKAYSQLTQGMSATIQAQAVEFPEDVTMDQAISLTLRGGYVPGFGTRSGYSVIHGILTIRLGSLDVDMFVVK